MPLELNGHTDFLSEGLIFANQNAHHRINTAQGHNYDA